MVVQADKGRIFINKISGIRWFVLNGVVTENEYEYYIVSAKTSLPKTEWEEIQWIK